MTTKSPRKNSCDGYLRNRNSSSDHKRTFLVGQLAQMADRLASVPVISQDFTSGSVM